MRETDPTGADAEQQDPESSAAADQPPEERDRAGEGSDDAPPSERLDEDPAYEPGESGLKRLKGG